MIVRALYGLKSAGNSWRQHFATKIREELGYQPCEADQDVYMKEATKPDGTKYWAYIIVYVDDVLCVNHDTKSTMDLISNLYRMKEGSIETPKVYLGANIKEWKLQDADGEFTKCYASSSNTYAKEAVRIVEGLMLKNNLSFFYPRPHFPQVTIDLSSKTHHIVTMNILLYTKTLWECSDGCVSLDELTYCMNHPYFPNIWQLLAAAIYSKQ